jgi:hypothetical protein
VQSCREPLHNGPRRKPFTDLSLHVKETIVQAKPGHAERQFLLQDLIPQALVSILSKNSRLCLGDFIWSGQFATCFWVGMKTSAFHKALWPSVLIDCIAAEANTHT